MADIIQLLPDAIANQIAAGEVIQRPASVVKELMENAIDAGSTKIKLILKDGGKTLIQVIDDGCGMSETDGRLCFERHATSKIREAKDLFAIHTMGFRGEALASVAAIAHLEMRTRLHAEELGTRIVIEGSKVKTQEACQCSGGTSIAIKNLFYNVPARRNFLKSDKVEMRHVLDEFQRIAIANPDIFMSLHHNANEIFHLSPGNLRQRIIGVFGNYSNKKLVPIVNESTEIVDFNGYIGKPEFAKKTRGEQMFFVNRRFIKSGYLDHAVMSAYEDVLSKDTYPLYIIFLKIDPKKIDINVHPTKQQIKFDDERSIYQYLKVCIRHSLSKYSVTPSMDFDQGNNIAQNYHHSKTSGKSESSGYGTSRSEQHSNSPGFENIPSRASSNKENWEKLYKGLEAFDVEPSDDQPEQKEPLTIQSEWTEETTLDGPGRSFSKQRKEPYQIHASYIVSQIKSGYLLIDQQAAHERILYEYYLETMGDEVAPAQIELFSKTITLTPADADLFKKLLPEVNAMGFDIQHFGKNTFIINGIPSDIKGRMDEQKIIEILLEQYKSNLSLNLDTKNNIARSMAKSTAIKKRQKLTVEEMQILIDKLFACKMPYKSPAGRSCFITYELEDLEKQFSS
ncbi:MAG: DNA mismatch repair endonuclease MutL [Bacteroidetes bacterium]|nr:DNA mismatch repair endonuclease MutL [Bacteroidota bacterium]